MGYEVASQSRHHVAMEERRSLTVSGVEDVERFDESSIVLSTTQGILVIGGEGLHIEKLSLEGGELRVEGKIDALTYEEGSEQRGGGFFSRLLR